MRTLTMILITLIISTATGNARSGAMSVAVLELDANGITRGEARVLTARLRSELVGIGKYDVMERERMNAVLHEQEMQQSGWMASGNVIELGRMMSVDALITGSIGRLGGKYALNLQMVDVETGMILGSADRECACRMENLGREMQEIALQLSRVEKRAEFTIQYYDKDNAAKGNFYIKSKPAGATVYLNDKMIRNVVTPLTIENLPAGNYAVRVEKGDLGAAAAVMLRVNEYSKVDLELKKKQGRLQVQSSVPQSDVYLDGTHYGTTPLDIPALDVGAYRLSVKKAGYVEYEEDIAVAGSRTLAVTAVLIKPGPVKVLSVPLEAAVIMDGETVGTTPMVLTNINPAVHVLELKKKGYAPYRHEFVITTSDETKLEPVLEPLAGTRRVRTVKDKPAGAGSSFDAAMKWVTIGGGAVFAAVLIGMAAQR